MFNDFYEYFAMINDMFPKKRTNVVSIQTCTWLGYWRTCPLRSARYGRFWPL